MKIGVMTPLNNLKSLISLVNKDKSKTKQNKNK